jgi:hypothetical protein
MIRLSRRRYRSGALIGRNASHGCIRLRNRDIGEPFEMASIADEVELHGERATELVKPGAATHPEFKSLVVIQ